MKKIITAVIVCFGITLLNTAQASEDYQKTSYYKAYQEINEGDNYDTVIKSIIKYGGDASTLKSQKPQYLYVMFCEKINGYSGNELYPPRTVLEVLIKDNIVKRIIFEYKFFHKQKTEITITKPDYAYLGVQYRMDGYEHLVPENSPRGVYIESVVDIDSPAAKAGFQAGDIIIGIEGSSFFDEVFYRLKEALSIKKAGDKIEFKVWRDSKILTITATLANYPK